MMKLNILNMKNFLEIVNKCKSEVHIICPDGEKLNINRQLTIQNKLLEKYRANKNSLLLTLDIPNPQDYMRIVFYYTGDC